MVPIALVPMSMLVVPAVPLHIPLKEANVTVLRKEERAQHKQGEH